MFISDLDVQSDNLPSADDKIACEAADTSLSEGLFSIKPQHLYILIKNL